MILTVKEFRDYLKNVPGDLKIMVSNDCVYIPRDYAISIQPNCVVIWIGPIHQEEIYET